MSIDWFLAQVKSHFGIETAKDLIVALRHENLVWKSLENENFQRAWFSFSQEDIQKWQPGFLAAFMVSPELANLDLSDISIDIPKTLLSKANKTLETIRLTGLPPGNLPDAFSLALTLREYRSSRQGWQGVVQFMASPKNNFRVWLSPFACLPVLIPDFDKLVAELVNSPVPFASEISTLIVHAVECTPMNENQRYQTLTDLLSHAPSEFQIESLKILEQYQEGALTKLLAINFLALNASPTGGAAATEQEAIEIPSIQEVRSFQQTAELSKLAGQPVQEAKALDQAFQALNHAHAAILHDLALQLEAVNPEEARKTWEEVLNLDDANRTYKQEYAEFLLAHDEKELGLELLSEIDDKNAINLFSLRYPNLVQNQEFSHEALTSALNRAESSRFTQDSDQFIAAQYAFDHKNYRLAADFIEKALQATPNDLKVIKLSGKINQHLADIDKAIESSSLLAMFEPENQENKRKLASLFLQTQQPEKAFEIYQDLIATNAENSREDLLTYAEIAIKAGRPEVAIPISENFLTHDPLDGEALVSLCNAYLAQGNVTTAIDLLERTSTIAPEKPASWISLAKIWSSMGETEKAMGFLRKAQAALPDEPIILETLGTLYLENDKFTEAISVLKQAFELEPANPQIRKSLSKAFLCHGSIEEAWEVIRPLEDDYTADPDLALTLGKTLMALGDRNESKPILRFAWQASRSDEAFVAYVSLILEQKSLDGQYTPADQAELTSLLTALTEKINNRPDQFDLRMLAGDIKSALGKSEEAYQDYLILLDMPESKSPRSYHHLQLHIGQTALKMGLTDISLASLQEAVLTNPDDLETRHDLVKAFLQAGLQEEANSAARAALQIAPSDIENVLWYSDFAFSIGNQREAIQILNDTIHFLPNERMLYLALARTYLKQNNLDETKAVLNQMLENKDITTEEFVNVANIYLHMNETEEASSILKKAISNNPAPNFEETRDLAYSVLRLGDAAAALQMMDEIQSSLTSHPCFPILKSDVLTANKKFIPALQILETALKQIEFNNDPHYFETETLPEDQGVPPYTRAGVYYRAAQLERTIGDLNAAQKYAGLAQASEPESESVKILQAELAFSVRNSARLDALLDQLQAAEHQSSSAQELTMLLVLNSLIERNLAKAQLISEHFLSKQPSSLLSHVMKAIFAANSGDSGEADLQLASAEKLWAELAAHIQQGSFDIGKYFKFVWASMSVALAAWGLGNWQLANTCLQNALKEIGVIPVVNQLLAEYLVDKARATSNSHALRITTRAPISFDPQKSDETIHEEQVSLAGRFIQAAEMIPTLKIGQAVFSGRWNESDEIGQIVRTGTQAAQVLSVQVNQGIMKEIVSAFGDNFEVNYQYAIMVLHDQPELSAKLAEKLLTVRPSDPRLNTILALSMAEPAQGAEQMEKALTMWPDEPDWQALAADCYEKAKDYPKAAHHLEEAIRILPKDAGYWQKLGDIKLLEKDYHAAKDYFGKAIDLFPDNPQALESLATINRQLGEHEIAIQCLQKAATLEPNNPAYGEAIAESLLACKDYAKAMDQSSKVLQSFPSSSRALLVKVKAMMEKRQFEEAKRVLQAAKEIVPDPIPFLLLGIELDEKMTRRSGLSSAQVLAEQNPENTEVLNKLAFYQIEAGLLKEAQNTLQRSLELNAENAKTLLIQGRMDRLQGNLDQALAHLSHALKLDPSLTEAYLEMGQTYQDRREVNRAIETYHKAIEIVAKDPRPYIQAAAAYKDSKDYRNAEYMLRQASQISPNDPGIRRQLAGIVALNLVNNLQEAPKRK